MFPKPCVIKESGTQTEKRSSGHESGFADKSAKRIDQCNKTCSEKGLAKPGRIVAYSEDKKDDRIQIE